MTQANNICPKSIRIIACGALAREIIAVTQINGLSHLDVKYLPALWHNNPEKITPGVKAAIDEARAEGYSNIFIAYADCGTGGALDWLCEKEAVQRIKGPHCYAFFSSNETFKDNAHEDMRCFFLTDFLTRQFRTLIIEPYRLDEKPEMIGLMFNHYERLVYLAQEKNQQLQIEAQRAAKFLGLTYEYRFTGYGDLETQLVDLKP